MSTLQKKIRMISTQAVGSKAEFSLRGRIFNVVSLVILFTLVMSIFWNNSIGILQTVNYLLAVATIFFIVIYYFARFKKRFLALPLVILTLISLTFLWISADGMNGSTPLLFLVAAMIFVSISKSREYLLYGALTFINLVLLFYVELNYHDELITHYPTEELRRNDLIFSFLITAFILNVLIVFFKRNYDIEKETIESQKIELEQANLAKDKLFSVISHDLRSPFQGMLGLSQLMVNESLISSPEEMRLYAKALHGSAEKTMVLVDNLLNWAKMQQQKIEVRTTKIHLRTFIEANTEFLQHQYLTRKNFIRLEVPGDLYVNADSDMLQSIVRNLLSNAFKFTDHDGEVFVRAAMTNQDKISISVTDNGVGMSQDLVYRLFSKETIQGATGLNGEKSAGIGLLLCRDFVDLQGGTIKAESTPGKGSIFTFTLPAAF